MLVWLELDYEKPNAQTKLAQTNGSDILHQFACERETLSFSDPPRPLFSPLFRDPSLPLSRGRSQVLAGVLLKRKCRINIRPACLREHSK